MHSFATAGHKEPSFKYGPWARYTSLITALTMFGVGLGGIFLSDPESFAGFGMYAMIISVPLAIIEWPIARIVAALPFLADYRWRALTYFILSIPMAISFPVQLGAFFLVTDAVLYFIGFLRGESGAPNAPKGNRV